MREWINGTWPQGYFYLWKDRGREWVGIKIQTNTKMGRVSILNQNKLSNNVTSLFPVPFFQPLQQLFRIQQSHTQKTTQSWLVKEFRFHIPLYSSPVAYATKQLLPIVSQVFRTRLNDTTFASRPISSHPIPFFIIIILQFCFFFTRLLLFQFHCNELWLQWITCQYFG